MPDGRQLSIRSVLIPGGGLKIAGDENAGVEKAGVIKYGKP